MKRRKTYKVVCSLGKELKKLIIPFSLTFLCRRKMATNNIKEMNFLGKTTINNKIAHLILSSITIT